MPRTHGYSQIGTRCYGKKDWHAKGRINVIGALLGSSLLCTCMFEANINVATFHQWVVQELIPRTKAGTVIVMNNATFHKRQDTKQAIKDAKLILEYLPPYSPDSNPIEHKWAQAKAIRRKTQKTVEQVLQIQNL